MKNHRENLTPGRGRSAIWLVALAALWLGGCVTHYYPAPGGAYGDYPLSDPYVAVTADVPAPSAGVAADNVIYYVDSAYYPWWSLDYFYLGYGFGYSGFSVGIRYGYPRPYYGWPHYAWYNPWYYPPYYSAWYPSHYWRPYYHPNHYYWAHHYDRHPPYGHRPGHDGHAGSNSWARPGGAGDQRRGPAGGLAGPAAPAPAARALGGSLGGGPAFTAYRPAPPSNAEAARIRPAVTAARPPGSTGGALTSAGAPGAKVISRSPGFSASTPVGAATPDRPAPSATRVIGRPVYQAPVRAASPTVRSPSPGVAPSGAPAAPSLSRPPLGNIRAAPPGIPASPVRNVPSGTPPLMSRPQPAVRAPSPAYAPASRVPAPVSGARSAVPRSVPRMSSPPRSAPPSRPATRSVARPVAKPKN